MEISSQAVLILSHSLRLIIVEKFFVLKFMFGEFSVVYQENIPYSLIVVDILITFPLDCAMLLDIGQYI